MLFNSHVFIFLFLPITLMVFFLIGRKGAPRLAISWLILSSLFFYAWWRPVYLVLILTSIAWNYGLGVLLCGERTPARWRKALLTWGIASNLIALAFFKYADFAVLNVNHAFGTTYLPLNIVLPLAISFFTFQQIAYLVDAYRRETAEHSFLQYCLFVSFFPQLIAGPIVHHGEMLPQFANRAVYEPRRRNLETGLTIFFMGLFKKVVIADGVAGFASPVFAAAEAGIPLTCLESWRGVLAYSFQLYFDFSGYSDMAIGLGYLFGIQLPLNFDSPYKATSVIDFWKRWHMTLSRFLRDYLYIPLGGSRKGNVRRHVNLVVTMLLGGLWHGAGWNFVVWGGLHGLYLSVNHSWRTFKRTWRLEPVTASPLRCAIARLSTFLAVMVGWVFFRSANLPAAMALLRSMAGLEGVVLPERFRPLFEALPGAAECAGWLGMTFGKLDYFAGSEDLTALAALLCVVWWAPNTQEIMRRAMTETETDAGADSAEQRNRAWITWRPTGAWAAIAATVTVVSVLHMSRVSEFLYFQF